MSNVKPSKSNYNSDSVSLCSQNFASIDYVSVKLAMRPIKFYKLVQCEKTKIHDYNYILEKIKLNGQNTSSINQSTKIFYTLFLKSGSKDEIKITDENDWKMYFEESGRSIFEMIDSKNTLKIEYVCKTVTVPLEEKNILLENEKVGLEILKSVFNIAMRNESTKKRIKEDLMNSESLNTTNNEISNFVNSLSFDSNLQQFFDKTFDKLEKLSNFKISMGKEGKEEIDNYSEILFEDAQEGIVDIPPFSEFYNNEQIEYFRSKIISESLSESKK